MYADFTDVQVGDEVVCSRGRSKDRICKVYHTTAKTFDVEGFGRFWKENGKGHGDSDSWYGRYAEKIEDGDRDRIASEQRRIKNTHLFSEHRVQDFTDSELEKVAFVIRLCNARRKEAGYLS